MESTCPVDDVTEFIDFDSFRQLSRALFDLKLLTCQLWNWKRYKETVNGVLSGFGCSFKIDNKKQFICTLSYITYLISEWRIAVVNVALR